MPLAKHQFLNSRTEKKETKQSKTKQTGTTKLNETKHNKTQQNKTFNRENWTETFKYRITQNRAVSSFADVCFYTS